MQQHTSPELKNVAEQERILRTLLRFKSVEEVSDYLLSSTIKNETLRKLSKTLGRDRNSGRKREYIQEIVNAVAYLPPDREYSILEELHIIDEI